MPELAAAKALGVQDIRHRVRAFILDGERLLPLAEVVGDDEDVAISIQCGGTNVKNVHSNLIPAMTGGNITQRVMTTGGRFPLHARCTLSQPIFYIVGHTRPIEPVTQMG